MYSENFKHTCILLIIGLLSLSTTMQAQDFDDLAPQESIEKERTPILNENIYFGGDLSLSLGSTFYFSAAPEAGYKIYPRLHAGVGMYYMYSSAVGYNNSISVYGTRLYGRAFPLQKIFVQGEYEMLNSPRYDPNLGYTKSRVWVPGVLAGLGYMEQGMGRLGLYIVVLYNFMLTEQTPYLNPVIRAGFIF